MPWATAQTQNTERFSRTIQDCLIWCDRCCGVTLIMPPFLLILFLLLTSSWITEIFVLIPLTFIREFHLPNMLIWGAVALVLFWCFGE
ncbi:hypothetical protein [Gloeocapsopsis dulcis]|uniref:Uncharacterized protein n=1 Tax=Gloeocapsopsis dulcis AAB1 = 1H9 TaxID=1433147 RepID=A0A6N8FRA2_9CHRO|nr:hypothetical protein [Gloeocapsopsis dulcis]MUL35304.1 hypothetical protein [Gloeocapsopsis dulcis AAB1 = 1H9]WNN90493.1 hypothetical protein P0S91_05250 [Gloeocapsopsis dulcis]